MQHIWRQFYYSKIAGVKRNFVNNCNLLLVSHAKNGISRVALCGFLCDHSLCRYCRRATVRRFPVNSKDNMPYFLIVDTETTCEDTVADFGAIVCDHRGNIVADYSALILGEFDRVDLFFLPSGRAWSRAAAARKREQYNKMLADGDRVLASKPHVNRWLDRINYQFNPTLTAYNLSFDATKCRETGINLEQFTDRFCLWHAAAGNICNTKRYRQFVMENHLFNAPTEKQNMTFKTNAEAVFGFLNGSMVQEPHTALEDARDFELPILMQVIRKKSWQDNCKPYVWQDWQVNKHFKAR